ncbi:hypothetical protein [Paraburkholderia bryophila]|uniref:Uncharacterized protein n=1 Tax=Paraburkholderia bryophila TaxID=420952 RepID=A0A329BXI0_9BURK|nr:hypothetical protein [Paraburkholderia bryophila]RAS26482.1 hypothetical protein BX591_114142 [Paraburkholderia bryophila]
MTAAAPPVRWPAIAALTAVSALAQIGQFGIGFMVLPVWLSRSVAWTRRAPVCSRPRNGPACWPVCG